ncbi:hypothetical protein PMZ80_009703 [Knufia obscura]|uniref:DUF302 domain-containing protein n=1 Tax=Knufia obscura TaxID=1635080 RepID=A0ABR0RBV5_9EURO|nr:hypothetical protein PMZ80_009703 [Knufia obscura]
MAVTTEPFTASRVIITSSISFDLIINRLRRQTNPQNEPVSEPFKPNKPYSEMSQAEYIQFINTKLGLSGFMYFNELEYGSWTSLLNVGEDMRMKRFIIGNPLVAITMLRHELRAALAVPVELLIRELEDGKGTEVVYLRPSDVMRVGKALEDEDLRQAAKELDEKLEALVKEITS